MIRKILVSMAALVAVVAAGFWVTAPRAADPAPYLALANKYDVRIVRDHYGVPHIFGDRDVDVSFGLALAHAEDDFATIRDVLLATRGKLATLHGPKAAKTDYLIQWMNVWGVVDAGYDSRISAATRAHAEAYADGLNFYLAEHPDDVVPGLLPVTGKDLIAGFTFKTPLFFGFDKVVADVVAGKYGTGLDKVARLEVTDAPQPEVGSQGIAVAPSRATDGYTRLLVNSHQPLTGPVAWYEARLKSGEGWDMAGGTFPGSPVILHGTGPTLGWASTVNKPDLVDVYALTINPDDENQYLLDGTWRDFEVSDAAIDVTFWGPFRWTFHEPIYRSAHGPVFKTEAGVFAIRWAGMDEMRTLEEMIAMNKARTQADFEAALAMEAMPSINYIYADREGHIAHYYNAMMPKRTEGVDYRGTVPGDRSELIWQGYHDFSDVPKTVNPPSGFVFNANNTPYVSTRGEGAPKAEDFPVTMGIETQMTNRAYRIERLFGDDAAISRDDFRAYKFDNRYDEKSLAAEVREKVLALSFPEGSNEAKGQEILRAWDLSTDRTSRAAALGTLTAYPFIMANMHGDEASPDTEVAYREAVAHLMDHFGRLDPEWGEVNRLMRGDASWPVSGGPDTLRAVYGEFEGDTGVLKDIAGDTYIMFVEWAPDGSQGVQSVHNFGSATLDARSKHYADQAPMFADERTRRLPLRMPELEAEKTADRHIGGPQN